MNDIVEIGIWIFVIWGMLQVARSFLAVMALKEVHDKVKDHLNKIIHEVAVEKHGEMEYWFDKETDQFLGQGKTVEEITSHVKARFPDHIFVLPPKGVLCAPKWEFTEKLDIAERAKHYGVE